MMTPLRAIKMVRWALLDNDEDEAPHSSILIHPNYGICRQSCNVADSAIYNENIDEGIILRIAIDETIWQYG